MFNDFKKNRRIRKQDKAIRKSIEDHNQTLRVGVEMAAAYAAIWGASNSHQTNVIDIASKMDPRVNDLAAENLINRVKQSQPTNFKILPPSEVALQEVVQETR